MLFPFMISKIRANIYIFKTPKKKINVLEYNPSQLAFNSINTELSILESSYLSDFHSPQKVGYELFQYYGHIPCIFIPFSGVFPES